jgi:CheY-like chemotaxis protein
MRATIRKEFGDQKPRAVVLDDSRQARLMTARKLKSRGFEVSQHATVREFREAWRPGTADVIIADWNLSAKASESGDHVLEEVRGRDWDVPFVLVSGKLDEADDRAPVLSRLLESGSARFVRRGNNGIAKACDEAEELIERRDLALLKVILSLRPAALANESVSTTTGTKSIEELLGEVVAHPAASHDFERPIATAISRERGQK